MINLAFEFMHTLNRFTAKDASTIDVYWVAPLEQYTHNIDGAFLKHNQSGDLGGVIRDSRRNWIISFS